MAQCHLTWDSFKKNICEGFANLQQQEEFVDMTLAAEGHLVKVHKNLLALASPYLKAVIQSAPCQHPVVFLTHIKHITLGYVLEYVYTGEVVLPVDDMFDFIEAAKALHIRGACNLIPPKTFQKASRRKETELKNDQDNTLNIISYRNNKEQNIEDHCLDTSEHNNLTSQTALDVEDYIDETPISQQSFQNHGGKNIGNHTNSDIETVISPNTYVAKINQSDKPISQTITEANAKLISEIDNYDLEEFEPEDIAADNNLSENMDIEDDCVNFQDGSEDKHFEDKSDTNMGKVLSEPNENYSINVEMPAGNSGPPKITIQAGVIENMPISSGIASIKTIQDVCMDMTTSNSDHLPKITIDAGIIQDIPGTSISKENVCIIDCDIIKPAPASTVCDASASSPFYMITSKGSLQMILNRYIYGIHHNAKQGRKLRWRCIDYRHNRCQAYIDTLGEVIVARKFSHNHPFHDQKIMNRGSTKQIFGSLKEVLKALDEKEKAS